MRKTKVAIVLAVAVCAVILLPGAAFANFAIHGGYSMDTDACAGCHRAHTSASTITWDSPLNPTTGRAAGARSALLISDAATNADFCYACHGAQGTGAETLVQSGEYVGSDYGDGSKMLLGGVFETNTGRGWTVTSTHQVDDAWGAYGGGPTGQDNPGSWGMGNRVPMSCSSCHDVHGSSNYRLLKDQLNDGYGAVAVGGYDGSGDPDPFVVSAEPGYPTDGWRLHVPGAAQMAGYTPNYTDPMYARAPGDDQNKGISNWCAGCHHQYGTRNMSTYGFAAQSLVDVDGNFSSEYNAGEFGVSGPANPLGLTVRHRHPVNVPLVNFNGPRDLIIDATLGVPVANNPDGTETAVDANDWVDCLTCHLAHGTASTMSGWADSALTIGTGNPEGEDTGSGGVPPTDSSALLRLNDRGVCQACHNK